MRVCAYVFLIVSLIAILATACGGAGSGQPATQLGPGETTRRRRGDSLERNADESRKASEGGGLSADIAPGRNRTCDLALRRRALYPLSYGRSRSSLVVAFERACS